MNRLTALLSSSTSLILTTLALISAIGGGAYWLESRYARAESVSQLANRLDYKILEDRYYQLQSRLWRLEDRYGSNCHLATNEVRNECRELSHAIEVIKDRLKKR